MQYMEKWKPLSAGRKLEFIWAETMLFERAIASGSIRAAYSLK